MICWVQFSKMIMSESRKVGVMQSGIIGIITFIIVFGIIVVVHEFGHFYFAKKSGILVRELAIGHLLV